ncbi:hypothetical protein BJ165DRAFT_1530017 [Panaeolus papilionaceus]|nr:hypothetical protein BJ165DRAFT_1530017 [Panaeolus papilionaceus]
MENDSNRLPGFGLPVNYEPKEQHPDYVGPLYPNALRSQSLHNEECEYARRFTDKPEWHIKAKSHRVHKEVIVGKWKMEVFGSGEDFTEKMFAWCTQELRHNALSIPEPPGDPPLIIVFDSNVVKSDFAVTPELRAELSRLLVTSTISTLRREHLPFSSKVITAVIPLWEMSLGPLQDREIRLPPLLFEYNNVVYDPDLERWRETEGPQLDSAKMKVTITSEDSNGLQRRVGWFFQNNSSSFSRTPAPVLNLQEMYGDLDFKGTWHVEGQLNERIVATVLYYDSQNITPSSLAFRQQIFTRTRTSRSIVRNILIGWNLCMVVNKVIRVFRTLGASILEKPGHRKILALFLVDPNIKVLKQSSQGPDQLAGLLGQLPVELQMHIFEDVDEFPIDMEEAKAQRLELMDERKATVVDSTF